MRPTREQIAQELQAAATHGHASRGGYWHALADRVLALLDQPPTAPMVDCIANALTTQWLKRNWQLGIVADAREIAQQVVRVVGDVDQLRRDLADSTAQSELDNAERASLRVQVAALTEERDKLAWRLDQDTMKVRNCHDRISSLESAIRTLGYELRPAKCPACGHSWDAMYHPGTDGLECPECHDLSGLPERRAGDE